MPLSKSAREEIQSELAALDQLQARIDARRKALQTVLEPFDFGQVTLPFIVPGSSVALTGVAAVATIGTVKPYANTGLRAAILDVLRKQGGMRSPKVADVLSAQGFPDDSSTKLSIRVYNDLWRMSKNGAVVNENGVFSVR